MQSDGEAGTRYPDSLIGLIAFVVESDDRTYRAALLLYSIAAILLISIGSPAMAGIVAALLGGPLHLVRCWRRRRRLTSSALEVPRSEP